MNKKLCILFICAITLCVASVQKSSADEKGAGCGIGKVILEGRTGMGPHIAAAILNDILVPRSTFMSTATSIGQPVLGCDPSQTVEKEVEQNIFVAENMDTLSKEIAQGGGLHLEALADMLGVADADKPNFFSMTQDNYSELSSHTSSTKIISTIKLSMAKNDSLAHYVQ